MKINCSINTKIINKNYIDAYMANIDGYYSFDINDLINNVIKKGYTLVPPQFRNKHRSKKLFISTDLIGIDIDHGLTLQEIFKDEFIKENALLLYTTFSHTEKDHRFRILFKLPKIIIDIKEVERILLLLVNKFDADELSKSAVHPYAGNTNAKVKVFGKILNLGELYGRSDIIDNNNQLVDKHSLKNMLKIIQEKIQKLEYKPWLQLCSSIWDKFTYEESINLLQKYYPEEKESDYKYKYKHRLDTIPYTYIIKLAAKCGFKPDTSKIQDFVRTNDKGKLIITPMSLDKFLYQNGIYTYFYNNNEVDYQVVKEKDNIVNETGIKKIYEFIKDYTLKNYNTFDAEDLLNSLNISNKNINLMTSREIEFHCDTVNNSFFYFQNGFCEITENNIIFHENYNQLQKYKLWKEHKKENDFHLDNKESEFDQFLMKLSNRDQDRYNNLCGVFGYLLHRYKNPHINKFVILNDEIINQDNPSGRTGKSLIAKALGHIRDLVEIDGKLFKPEDRFRFQDVGLSTNIIHMDDIPSDFNLKTFYSIATGGLKTEEKGEHSFIIPFKKSPKIVFSSNYTVNTGGGSDRARVVEIELYNYYNENFQPKHEFGHLFFDDWEQTEWNRFYTFCAQCVQKYLKIGLLNTISNSLLFNKIKKLTSEKFADWINRWNFYDDQKSFFSAKELYESFNLKQKEYIDMEYITANKFTKFLKIYLNIMEIPYEAKGKRIDGEIVRGYQIINR